MPEPGLTAGLMSTVWLGATETEVYAVAFLFGCMVLIVGGTAAVHAALYRRLSPWPAVSALFVYSLLLNQGFVNYLLGVGVWLLAFAAWIVLRRMGRAGRAAS